jgi:hypothetical protein
LKKHKTLPVQLQGPNLTSVLAAVTDYIPYLFALDAGLSGGKVAGEEIDIVLEKELELEWRATLTPTVPGCQPPRVKLRSLEYEVSFVLSTLATLNTLLARYQLLSLYGETTPTTEQRTSLILTATRYLLQSASIHSYLATRAAQWNTKCSCIDICSSTQSALASLAHAEATLLAVLKDDPYPAVVTQDRNKNDNEWMIKAPEIPKVRAHLFARLSLAATEHAAQALAMLGDASNKVDGALIKYIGDLRKVARGKACRFLGIDADLGGMTGTGIAWLMGGKMELGMPVKGNENKSKGFSKLKKEWSEKREDKKILKGADWGTDAGRVEEGRVIEMLEKKWVKMNDTVRSLSCLSLCTD